MFFCSEGGTHAFEHCTHYRAGSKRSENAKKKVTQLFHVDIMIFTRFFIGWCMVSVVAYKLFIIFSQN